MVDISYTEETETWESSDFLDAGEGESFFDKITNGSEQLFHAVHFPGDGAPPVNTNLYYMFEPNVRYTCGPDDDGTYVINATINLNRPEGLTYFYVTNLPPDGETSHQIYTFANSSLTPVVATGINMETGEIIEDESVEAGDRIRGAMEAGGLLFTGRLTEPDVEKDYLFEVGDNRADKVYKLYREGRTLTAGKQYEFPALNKTGGANWFVSHKKAFRVSDTKTVFFAPANLRAVRTGANENGSWTGWRFEFMEHQYSIQERTDSDMAYDYNGKDAVGLFTFGASGYNKNQMYWQPWSCNIIDGYKYQYLSQTGNAGKYNDTYYFFQGDLRVEKKSDWSSNVIFNYGENDTTNSGWYTLSTEEWEYLINRHSNFYNTLLAEVCDVKGLILFPEYWDWPEGCEPDPSDLSSYYGLSSYYTSYDDTRWSKMEKAGAVFLPAAGIRVYTTNDAAHGNSHDYPVISDYSEAVTGSYKNIGYYWSSNQSYINFGDDQYREFSQCLSFNQDEAVFLSQVSKSYGCSVRLVRNAE